MKLICNGIPEHGLLLINPCDVSKDQASLLLRREWKSLPESLQSDCVAFLNQSDRAVVAYQLVWKVQRGDESQQDEKSLSNMDVLMGMEHGEQGFANFDDPTIGPGCFRLFSTVNHGLIDQSADAGMHFGIGSFTGGYSPKLQPVSDDPERTIVTIDGAFYADGTFVGPDETGYFDSVSIKVKAKRDLLEEISTQVKSGGSISALIGKLSMETSSVKYQARMSTEETYQLYRSWFVQELSSLRRGVGDIRFINRCLQQLRRDWPALKRI